MRRGVRVQVVGRGVVVRRPPVQGRADQLARELCGDGAACWVVAGRAVPPDGWVSLEAGAEAWLVPRVQAAPAPPALLSPPVGARDGVLAVGLCTAAWATGAPLPPAWLVGAAAMAWAVSHVRAPRALVSLALGLPALALGLSSLRAEEVVECIAGGALGTAIAAVAGVGPWPGPRTEGG
ncbi:MAG: hypothetical protein H6732_18995 [Alphaproteobacteria bacterium]|nr:hypothetical protein [Alphaproteobacteria bacterium]